MSHELRSRQGNHIAAPGWTIHIFPKEMGLLVKSEPLPVAEPEWRPADPPVNGNAIREALRAPHWSDDAALTAEERAERERMESGHA